ncbi:MAG TPA: 2-isopropylmalate synthase [Steroidobacteraceae bacterium]|nr:2-isopropylmalate synthase [Steroidobacteraceae bacterium]
MPTDPERVTIFDTTLRDGEQAPGCGMTQAEKLRVARALAELGVDVIEAGFPGVGRGDWDSVKAVAREVQGPVICALARCRRDDIELAAGALEPAHRRRLHVYLGTSPIFREQKLRLTPPQIISTAVSGVAMARELCSDVEFSPEDASRTELEFLAEVIERVIAAGATTINIPDTMGYTVPDEFSELFRYLRTNVRGIDRVTLSVHCHDDLGMAVANSLTAVVAGARQIECTINGIGERAGNCSLEEVVMALRTRTAFFNLATQIRSTRLYPVSRLVSNITGVLIPRNKAVVGESAVLQEDVGLPRSTLALGRHSDREALRGRLQALGFELESAEFERVFAEFRSLAERKKELFDGDIEALVLRVEGGDSGPWALTRLRIISSSGPEGAQATLNLRHRDGRVIEQTAQGDGPVDAAFLALEAATGVQVSLRTFEVRAVSEGQDAQGEAVVNVEYRNHSYRGASASTDIVEAGTRAFLEVINRIELSQALSE